MSLARTRERLLSSGGTLLLDVEIRTAFPKGARAEYPRALMNHRRSRRRRSPKCAICTPHRQGNANKGGTHSKVAREAAKRGADRVEQ